MFVDIQTVKELEIFHSPDAEGGIIEFFHHTITTGGRYKLKDFFGNPHNNIDDIIKIQNCLKFFINDIDRWKLNISDKQLSYLLNYLSSNIEPLKESGKFRIFLGGIKYSLVEMNYFNTFKTGINDFLKIVKYFNDYIKNIPNPPELMLPFINLLLGLHDDPVLKGFLLGNKTLGFIDAFILDRYIRLDLKHSVDKFIQFIYELDAYISIASTIKQYKLVFPEFINSYETSLEIKGIYHLFLNNPVKNNLNFTKEKNFMFLTGPNMAGKTTFLKSIGVAVYMAHLGLAVPADNMKLSVLKGLFTNLFVTDSIRKGRSYYLSEVLRIKEAALLIKKNNNVLVIFDEIFKGTNVKDAYDATGLVISGLINWKDSFFILSTHLLELEDDIKKFVNIQYFNFDSKIENDIPVFKYKLKEGVSSERLGALILKNEGVLDILNNKEVSND